MKTQYAVALALSFASLVGVGACIIPDKDIVVIVSDPCGEEWAVQTVGAYGYDTSGLKVPIKAPNEQWISQNYCLNEAQGAQMVDPTSDLASELLFHIALVCQARATEMDVVDTDQTCTTKANIAYIGECQQPSAGCEEPPAETGGEETGGTGGTDETSGSFTDFGSLDLHVEIQFSRGEYLVSEHLIATALADPLGLSFDGTSLKQVIDESGESQGFAVGGVASGNLGMFLGLRNGDVLMAIDGQPTRSFEQLLQVGSRLLELDHATVTILRAGSIVSLRYRRQ